MEFTWMSIIKALITGVVLGALYLIVNPYIRKLGSNGRALAYVLSIFAWPGILVICLAIAEIHLGLILSLTSALAFGFSFGFSTSFFGFFLGLSSMTGASSTS